MSFLVKLFGWKSSEKQPERPKPPQDPRIASITEELRDRQYSATSTASRSTFSSSSAQREEEEKVPAQPKTKEALIDEIQQLIAAINAPIKKMFPGQSKPKTLFPIYTQEWAVRHSTKLRQLYNQLDPETRESLKPQVDATLKQIRQLSRQAIKKGYS